MDARTAVIVIKSKIPETNTVDLNNGANFPGSRPGFACMTMRYIEITKMIKYIPYKSVVMTRLARFARGRLGPD
jgi:hypothetical protein